MIGKITIGKSFAGCLDYCLNDKVQKQKAVPVMKDRAEVIMYNQCYGSVKELLQQFNEVRALNEQLKKPVLHITLSLAPGEQLPKDKLMGLCQECAKDMGFENNQYVAIHHRDTSHSHVHIVANRVGYDRRTVSDSKNYQKIAAYCRRMEQQFELKEVLSPRLFLSKEERLLPRQDIRKEQLKNDIQQTLKTVHTYPEFEQAMRSLGYQVIRARGICFIDDKKVKIKGSEVGFSLSKIEQVLALKQTPGSIQKQKIIATYTSKITKENRPENTSSLLLRKSFQPGNQNHKNINESYQKSVQTNQQDPESRAYQNQEMHSKKSLQKNAGNLISTIMTPEKMEENVSFQLLKKKPKRRKRQHLSPGM